MQLRAQMRLRPAERFQYCRYHKWLAILLLKSWPIPVTKGIATRSKKLLVTRASLLVARTNHQPLCRAAFQCKPDNFVRPGCRALTTLSGIRIRTWTESFKTRPLFQRRLLHDTAISLHVWFLILTDVQFRHVFNMFVSCPFFTWCLSGFACVASHSCYSPQSSDSPPERSSLERGSSRKSHVQGL